SMAYSMRALRLAESLETSTLLTKACSQVGITYYYLGDYEKSYTYQSRALRLAKRGGDPKAIAANHLNISLIYTSQGDYVKALEHQTRAKKLSEKHGLETELHTLQNSIGFTYFNQRKYETALIHFRASDSLNRLLGRWDLVANEQNNMGSAYQEMGKYDEAIRYFRQGLAMYDSLGLATSKATSFYNLAETYLRMNRMPAAGALADSSIQLSAQLGFVEMEMMAYELKARVLARMGDFDQAYALLDRYLSYKDSVYSQQKAIAMHNMEVRLEMANQENRYLQQEERLRNQTYLLYLSGAGILVLVVLAGLFLARMRYRRRTSASLARLNESLNQVLTQLKAENEQNMAELEQAHDLQQAILPKVLPKVQNLQMAIHMETAAFVGGDFYDFYPHADGSLTFAVGDATGHGLKAAFLVTVAKSHFQQHAAAEELEDIVKALSDGITALSLHEMYLALSVGRLSNGILELYSAAMPPAWLVRQSGEVIELEARGTFLGLPIPMQFNPSKVMVRPGDLLVVMTDGYPDMMNAQEEPMGYDCIRSLLPQIKDKPIEAVLTALTDMAKDWQGAARLEDDLTLLAIRITPQ
ncbi:MAG: SpoIIE family protein phosphatase, partial [Sphingobacteriia bacterium]